MIQFMIYSYRGFNCCKHQTAEVIVHEWWLTTSRLPLGILLATLLLLGAMPERHLNENIIELNRWELI